MGRPGAFFASLALLIALPAVDAPGSAGTGSVDGATTGNNSELVETIPITERVGPLRTVMRLAPAAMPGFREGDELRVSAEVSVTTDCTRPQPRCTGVPHTFDPRIESHVVLVAPAGEAVLARDSRRCVQQPGDRQHHCVIPFHGIEAEGPAERLGCASDACAIELRMAAHNRNARGGEVLIIGGQDETGHLHQDKGRINAIRLRGRPETRLAETALERDEVPPDLKKRVVLSQRLDPLKRGDVIEASVDLRASVGHLPYPALVSSQIALTESPRSIRGQRFVAKVSNLRGELTEGGGTNCTQAQTPCPVFRTGTLHIREDSETPRGERVPLFLNVIIRANNKLQPERPGDVIRLRDTGGLRTKVYRGR